MGPHREVMGPISLPEVSCLNFRLPVFNHEMVRFDLKSAC